MPNQGPQPPSDADIRAAFETMTAGGDLDTLRALAAAAFGGDRAEAPDRRRPPRHDVATYRVRVDLDDPHRPIWRQIEVRSDLTLDRLHDVLQAAMGWTDSHLHEFAVGGSRQDLSLQRFVTALDIEEGEHGVPEVEVRLDEVLQDPGDEVLYTYDFGDGWDHTLRLETVEPWDDTSEARCTDGAGGCPPEDCGGTLGYEELLDLARRHATDEALTEDERERLGWTGLSGSALLAAADHFDPAEVVMPGPRAEVSALPPLLADLATRCRVPARNLLLEVAAAADLDAPLLLDTDAVARQVAPFRWFVQHVGSGGVRLTAAGYLPPSDVEAAVAALGLADEWVGTLNRECHTLPVLLARQSAQRLGLLRIARGRLVATRAGLALVDDPVAMWRHITARLPLERDGFARDAALVLILSLAVGDGAAGVARELMTGLGWVRRDGRPLEPRDLRGYAESTHDVLVRMGVVARTGRRGAREPGAAALIARAVLQRRE
ncbi:plasmid pRiA4b ORF-3 family protein [Actinotalea sp. K2]|uniref:plasmid pRiA4b ORF-3 family protein n=1 Tax=Actinotalea sp. K2 TaxID=2939438 RepID=UPI002017F572|nr:plasmid pRiA4b ORF-3 family protein [Actinotalea sp. K2]MCL3860797.1 plasmid pRiA4b ORF-3 family protein [Actinotalea sp. K2]